MAFSGAIPTQSTGPVAGGSNLPAVQPSTAVILQHPAMGRAMSLQAVTDAENRDAEQRQNAPLIVGLAGHISRKFYLARDAKREEVEPRMLHNLRARRSQYDPDKMAEIKKVGGSDVFAGITGQKCRAAASWLRDILLTSGSERPWSVRATPVAELPPEINDLLVEQATQPIKEALLAGQPIDPMQTVTMMSMLRDQAMAAVREEATKRAERMADKMEDQLEEGGFRQALDQVINDMTTFPSAILKGPVIRMRPQLTWGPNNQPVVKTMLTKEWERVSPFDIFPSPGATTIEDGDLIERHRLSRGDLEALKGVPGYDSAAIDLVLRDFGGQGLRNWLFDMSDQYEAEGRPQTVLSTNPDGLIDALQYWGSVQGQLLLDWGMSAAEVPDAMKEYQVESWQIGPYVIKAMLNPDPLNRRPYYKCAYEEVPGSFWGNSVADLVNDPQEIMNAAARAMVNNAALSSGPQVGILSDRLAPGEDVTQMYPWRIWQLNSDPFHGTAEPPITFFQPQSNVQELMALFERWSLLADEYSGIPRYMTGDARAGGAGRTASGLSMLMTNAGKQIKSVLANVDIGIIEPALQRLYYYNMRYETDPELKGDVCIVARGASALEAKESAQVRRNEFMAATANPIDSQIVGVEGRAAILRETAKGLDMDVDKIVPSIEVLRQKFAAKAAMEQQAATGTPAKDGQTQNNKQQLTDGSAITDNM